jgi:hypothetical protein
MMKHAGVLAHDQSISCVANDDFDLHAFIPAQQLLTGNCLQDVSVAFSRRPLFSTAETT